jgi:hypothetical protein
MYVMSRNVIKFNQWLSVLRIRICLGLLHFRKSDPHQKEKLDPDPHQIQFADTDPHQSYNSGTLIKIEPCTHTIEAWREGLCHHFV